MWSTGCEDRQVVRVNMKQFSALLHHVLHALMKFHNGYLMKNRIDSAWVAAYVGNE